MARRNFSREFKLEAVRLVEERGVTVAQAARDLDIHDNVLRRWVRQYRDDPAHAFPGAGQMKPEQSEIAQLKKEIEIGEMGVEPNNTKSPGADQFTWSFGTIPSGEYEVSAQWVAHSLYASNAPYTVNHSSGSTVVEANQKASGGVFNLLGTFSLDAGSSVMLSDLANSRYVIADAIRLVQVSDNSSFTWQAPEGTFDVYAKWTQDASHASDAVYDLHYAWGPTAVTANQQINGTGWNLLGIGSFDAGGKVVLNSGSTGNVVADAIKFVDRSSSVDARYYYYHGDHLDTPQVMTDGGRAVVWAADYDPFGTANITVATLANNLRFPGQYYDQETGMHYNYFRTYDPSTGRYLESDPIGLEGGLNTYGYVGGNPLGYIDPFGLVKCTCKSEPGTRPLQTNSQGAIPKQCVARCECECPDDSGKTKSLDRIVGGVHSSVSNAEICLGQNEYWDILRTETAVGIFESLRVLKTEFQEFELDTEVPTSGMKEILRIILKQEAEEDCCGE